MWRHMFEYIERDYNGQRWLSEYRMISPEAFEA